MADFTPDELRKYWKRKYDNWNFTKNARGEWVGMCGKLTGHIVSKIGKDGDYPDVQLHELISTGGIGGNIWAQAYRNYTKTKGEK